jgi:hypothetical protein
MLVLTACSDDTPPVPAAGAGGEATGGGAGKSGASGKGGTSGAGGSAGASGNSGSGGTVGSGGIAGADGSVGGSANAGSSGTGGSAGAGGRSSDAGDAGDGSSGTLIGPAGGTVSGPGGASVVVPAGALASSIQLRIAEDATGAPALPKGFAAIGPVLAFTPHGTTFSSPVTVTVPFNPALLPTGETPLLFKAEQGGSFAQITSTQNGNAVNASVSNFSWMVAARDLSHGDLRVVIDADDDIAGRAVATGPAGAVVIQGVTQGDLDGSNPTNQNTCFVAKLTAILEFEWVHQYPSCFNEVVIGPTGNTYFTIETTPAPTKIQLMSLNPAGDIRAGFPVEVGPGIGGPPGVFVRNLALSGQDDVTVYGYQEVTPVDGRYAVNTRSFLASWTSSGQVSAARAFVDYGATGVVYDFPWAMVMNSGGLWLSTRWEERLSPSGAALGQFIQRFTPTGTVPTGFPISTAGLANEPVMLGALPATEDIVGVTRGGGVGTPPKLIRYQGTGSVATGYPKDLVTGSSKVFEPNSMDIGPIPVDGQGNLFLRASISDPATPNAAPDIVVLSYTSAGALRAGYPVVVGNEYTNQVPDHEITALAINGTGTLYMVGEEAHATIAGQRSLIIHRMAGR